MVARSKVRQRSPIRRISMEEPQKLVSNPFSKPLFDQFALSDQLGNNYGHSTRIMRILRSLRQCSPIGEGKLSGKCDEKMFNPEWSQFLNLLLQWGWIKTEPTGHGKAIEISLTAKGEEFL